jgi:PIN domain nuclease of toxin-antitoxin system
LSVYVTDTHPLIWYTAGKHSQLSPRVVRIFDAAFAGRSLIVIPSPVLWEISFLVEHDKIRLREPFHHWAAALAMRRGIDVAALGLDVIAEAHSLRFLGDPFDRTIVATAKLMGVPLLTKDQIIADANIVEIVW